MGVNFNGWFKCLFRRLLKDLSDSAVTTDSGSDFNESTIRILKLLHLTYRHALGLNNLRLCPLVEACLANVNSISLSTSTIPYIIFYVCTISTLPRQYSKVGRPNGFDLSTWWMTQTFNKACSSSLNIFNHNFAHFIHRGQDLCCISNCGRTIVLYKFKNISLSMLMNVLNIFPKFRFTKFTLDVICFLKFKFLSIMTQRSFSCPIFLYFNISLITIHSIVYCFSVHINTD